MGHPVVEGGDGHPVGENTLQADEEQPCWEGHPGPHVVERLGVIDLPTEQSERPSELVSVPNRGEQIDASRCGTFTWKLPTMTRPTALVQPDTRALVLIQHWWLCSITWA